MEQSLKVQYPWNSNSAAINTSCVVKTSAKTCPPLSHCKNNPKKQLFDNLLRLQLFQILLERERNFKRIYFATFEKNHERTAQSHAYQNRFNLRHYLAIGQKVLRESYQQDLSKHQKLQQRRLRPFTVSKRLMNKIHQTKDDTDPTITKTVHRIQLVEYQPQEILPPLIGKYVLMDKTLDDFYEKFMGKWIQTIDKSLQPSLVDSFRLPIEILRAALTAVLRKRNSNTSGDSGVNSSQVISQATSVIPDCLHTPQPYLRPKTSRRYPLTYSPSRSLTAIQHFEKMSKT